MTDQGSFFDKWNEPMTSGSEPVMLRPDSNPVPIAAPAEDAPRLAGQNGAILARLRKGPVTNVELAEISLKYTSRISDLRKYLNRHYPGQRIVCEKDPKRAGVNVYELV